MRRLNAYPVYLLFAGATALLRTMHFTVAAVYYVTVVGLNPLQLVLVGTTLMIVILLSEVPTGVVADVYSRRLSVVVGTCLIGTGFVVEGAIPHFAAVLAAQLIWGIGVTFTSGALEAWIADELRGDNLGHVYVRGAQVAHIGALIGIVASVALASLRINLPMITAGSALIGLGAFLAFAMPEHGFTRAPRADRTNWQIAMQTLRDGAGLVRQRPVLVTILGIMFFCGMASETFDRLWEVHFLTNFAFPDLGRLASVVWFGIINAVALLLSIGAGELVRRRLDIGSHHGAARALFAITALLMVSMIAFGLAGSFAVALIAYWAAYVLRRTDSPITIAWINQSIDPSVRATVLSIGGQVDAIGQIAGGPLFGIIATTASTGTAMVAAGLVLAPALLLYGRTMRRRRHMLERDSYQLSVVSTDN